MHIESRPSRESKGDYAFFVACDDTKGGLKDAIDDLRNNVKSLNVLTRDSEIISKTDDAGQFTSSARPTMNFEESLMPLQNLLLCVR